MTELQAISHQEQVRLCMARARAEQAGKDTSKFPPRVRNMNGDAVVKNS